MGIKGAGAADDNDFDDISEHSSDDYDSDPDANLDG